MKIKTNKLTLVFVFLMLEQFNVNYESRQQQQ